MLNQNVSLKPAVSTEAAPGSTDSSPEKIREERYSARTYPKRDVCIVRGEGVRVYDVNDKSYIDCVAGIGATTIGHAHPRMVEAVSDQVRATMSVPELLCNNVRAKFQEKLLSTFPSSFNRVFFCNSGTESIEGGLKFARLTTGRPGIVALNRGYHGKTMGSLSATWEPKFREPFLPLLPDTYHVVANKLEAFEELFVEHGDKIGCYVFEPIQGEGGVQPLDVEFVKKSVEIARKAGALIVIDEVQSGVGRTGKMWAFEHFGIEPDLVCMAKGLAGGVPMGAVAIGDRVPELPLQCHTSTFGGNPLACRAALCVQEVIAEENLLANAEQMGAYVRGGLAAADIKCLREVRGMGLMIGIELKEKAGRYVFDAMAEGLLCLMAGTRVIRLLPPLTLSKDEANEIVSILVRVLSRD